MKRLNGGRRAFSLLEMITSMFILGVVMVALAAVSSSSQASSNMLEASELIQTQIINTLETMQYSLNTVGSLPTGENTQTINSNYKTFKIQSIVTGSSVDGVYYVKLVVNLPGTRNVGTMEAVLSRGVQYE